MTGVAADTTVYMVTVVATTDLRRAQLSDMLDWAFEDVEEVREFTIGHGPSSGGPDRGVVSETA